MDVYCCCVAVFSVGTCSYRGHANGIGALKYVDHKITPGGGVNGMTIIDAATQFNEQGAVFSINHESMDWGTLNDCIGCKWEYVVSEW